jgi:hypothetical protein
MTRNIGTIDRLVRVAVGLAILSLYFLGPQSNWALLGLIPLVTAFVGWCPPYSMLGISTCNRRTEGT